MAHQTDGKHINAYVEMVLVMNCRKIIGLFPTLKEHIVEHQH